MRWHFSIPCQNMMVYIDNKRYIDIDTFSNYFHLILEINCELKIIFVHNQYNRITYQIDLILKIQITIIKKTTLL